MTDKWTLCPACKPVVAVVVAELVARAELAEHALRRVEAVIAWRDNPAVFVPEEKFAQALRAAVYPDDLHALVLVNDGVIADEAAS